MKTLIYEGILQTYFATGEGSMLTMFLNEDKYKTPNPNFNKNDPKSGPPFYQSWNGTVATQKFDVIEIIDSPLSQYNGRKFNLGNFKLAAENGWELGASYPIEQIPLKDWYELFTCEKTIAKLHRRINKIVYYGGTFDPIHQDHKKIIQELTYSNDLVLVLPGNNWTKGNEPTFSLDERINSVKAVCNNWYNALCLDWAKDQELDTSSTQSVCEKIKDEFGVYPIVVIGSDNVKNIEKWKSWDELKKRTFLILNRGELLNKEDLTKFEGRAIYWSQFRSENHSSTQIRKDNQIDLIPVEAQKELDLKKLSQSNTDMIKK